MDYYYILHAFLKIVSPLLQSALILIEERGVQEDGLLLFLICIYKFLFIEQGDHNDDIIRKIFFLNVVIHFSS